MFHLLTVWLSCLEWPWTSTLLRNCKRNAQAEPSQKAPLNAERPTYPLTVSTDGPAFPSATVSYLTSLCRSFLMCINGNNSSTCLKGLLWGKNWVNVCQVFGTNYAWNKISGVKVLVNVTKLLLTLDSKLGFSMWQWDNKFHKNHLWIYLFSRNWRRRDELKLVTNHSVGEIGSLLVYTFLGTINDVWPDHKGTEP